jgi:hypothetical protein
MEKRGYSKHEALLAVGWKPKDGSEPRFLAPAFVTDPRPQWDEPPERWQRAARDFYRACQEILWSDAGRAALDYLRGRGLTDNTIRYAMLGYHPHEEYGAAHQWGRSVKLWQGIVIPWVYEGAIWRLTIRDERVVSGTGRYRQVGGGSNGLYLADSLRLHHSAVVVTEGEFDALSVAQACGKRVAVVATGTTQGGHTPRWLGLLERKERVLIAFDGEEKGDRAANWWLARLSNAQRLRPLWGDANQMLQDGADLTEWIANAGGNIPAPDTPQVSSSSEHEPLATPLQDEPIFSKEVSAAVAPPSLPLFTEKTTPFHTPYIRNDGTRCLTQVYLSEKHPRHIGFPSWIDPNDRHFLGWEVRNAYLQGDVDVMGNWWCGLCFYRCQLINLGTILSYPELPSGYRIEGYPCAGYEAWLALAQYGGSVRVETAVRWVFAPTDRKWRAYDYRNKSEVFHAS